MFILIINIRKKFFMFIINIALIASIALYYNLDGLVMLFLISELTIIFVFIVLFSQMYSYVKSENLLNTKVSVLFIILILILMSVGYSLNIISYKNFFSFYNIAINDFYYIYYSYFEKQVLLTVIILLIITFYSMFFILLFYSFKQFSLIEQKTKQNIFLLRKQNLIHQNNYNIKLRIFKSKLYVSKKFILSPQ